MPIIVASREKILDRAAYDRVTAADLEESDSGSRQLSGAAVA